MRLSLGTCRTAFIKLGARISAPWRLGQRRNDLPVNINRHREHGGVELDVTQSANETTRISNQGRANIIHVSGNKLVFVQNDLLASWSSVAYSSVRLCVCCSASVVVITVNLKEFWKKILYVCLNTPTCPG